jgi:hypothetical protein
VVENLLPHRLDEHGRNRHQSPVVHEWLERTRHHSSLDLARAVAGRRRASSALQDGGPVELVAGLGVVLVADAGVVATVAAASR